MEQKKNKKKLIVLAAALAVCLLGAGIIYMLNRPGTSAGAKIFQVAVIDNEGVTTIYEGHTDQEYLRGLLEELEGFSMSGTESEYGLMVEVVNGVSAVYDVDNAYWSFYVNDEYCNYGVDTQPVNDGDHFKIVYTPAE